MRDKLYRLKKFEWMTDGKDHVLPSFDLHGKASAVRALPSGKALLRRWNPTRGMYVDHAYDSVEAAKARAEENVLWDLRNALEEVREGDLRCVVETDGEGIVGSARVGSTEEAEALFVGIAKELSDLSEEAIVEKRDADGYLGVYGDADVHILPVEFIS